MARERNLQRDSGKRASLPAGSWIEPVLELNLEAVEHFFFDAFDVSEPAPASQVTVLGRTFNLCNKPLPPNLACLGIFAADAVCKVRQFVLPVLGP